MRKNNLTPVIVLAFVAVILLIMGYMGRQSPQETEPSKYTILDPPSDVTCMVEQDDVLWVGGKEGVVKIDIETKSVQDIQCDERMTYTRHMLIYNETLWIGHDRGLTWYNNSGCETLTEEDGMIDDRVNYLMEASDGALWAGTWHGAYYYQEGAWESITVDDGLMDNYVNVMIEDNYGGIWFGSNTAPEGGISIYHDGKWQYFNTENGLVHNNIVQFYEDTDGSIWASTGLLDIGAAIKFQYLDGEWKLTEILNDTHGLPKGKIRSVYRDNEGYLWVGSENNGLAIETPDGFKIITRDDGLSHDEVKVYYVDEKNNLWLGTRYGITILSENDIDEIRNEDI